MSIIISVIILILAMLISFFMQLTPGTFALFYHYALGKTSAKKADDRSLSFILGTEIFVVTVWLIIYFLAFFFFYNASESAREIFVYIMAGIFFAEAFAGAFLYYRKGKSTALFLSRRLARSLDEHIKKQKTRSDCILLGAFTSLIELVFTLPLYIISASILVNSVSLPHPLIAAIFPIIAVLPLFIIRNIFRFGRNLAEIQRVRVKLKPFVRSILFFGYILLGLAIIYLGVINHG